VLLVSWNVNSLNVRLPRVLELLAAHAPDIVCLQETKVAADAFPHAELADAGYRAVDHSAGRWAGVAVLAREGLALRATGRGLPGEAVPDEARWIEADVDGTVIASVYVPNGRSLDSPEFPNKLAFLEAMGRRAADGPLDAILGDMNIAPADADVYDPAAFVGGTHVTQEERDHIAAFGEQGFVDAFRAVHPDDIGYTWWDYRAGNFHKGLGLRIDLALLRGDLAKRLRECGIDRGFRKGSKPSDHAPLLVRLDEAGPPLGKQT
jgi:exodeoxyribonuclease III